MRIMGVSPALLFVIGGYATRPSIRQASPSAYEVDVTDDAAERRLDLTLTYSGDETICSAGGAWPTATAVALDFYGWVLETSV